MHVARTRTAVALLAVGTMLVAVPAATAAPTAPGRSRSAAPLPATGAPTGAVDAELQAVLDRSGLGDQVDVLVGGVGATAGQAIAGRFALRHDYRLVRGFAARMTVAQVRALSRSPQVTLVQLDGTVRAMDSTSERDFGATDARADRPGLDGSGVTVCIIDTGVDDGHEQLSGRVTGWLDLVGGEPAPYDDQGHGTHVAGIALGDGTGSGGAAASGGVATAASLVAVKVLDELGYGSDSDVIAGIDYCAGRSDVDIISMSLGDDVANAADMGVAAVDAAVAAGKVVVVAAGNSGDQPSTIATPGIAASAITVGAVAEHSGTPGTSTYDPGVFLAPFSSRGPAAYTGAVKPDVVAPGVSISAAEAGTVSGYAVMSGTSMATPYVAGVVALGLEAVPSATPAQVKAALESSSADRGPAGKDNDWGSGLVDARAFVDVLAGAASPRATAFPTVTTLSGSVPTNGATDLTFTVGPDGVGHPVSATVTIAGQAVCSFFCLFVEWSPDLDVELYDPAGRLLSSSACGLEGDLGCGIGRQETVGAVATTSGTYRLRVYAFTGSPNNGKGGSFTADVSAYPLGGTSSPPPPPPDNVAPVADAGADRTIRTTKRTVKFSLDGRGSYDPDGTITSYAWYLGTQLVGTSATLTQTQRLGTYTYRLVVTDDDGATDDDDVVVTVSR